MQDNQNPNFGTNIGNTFAETLGGIISFLPNFLGGLLILLIGVVIASLLRTITQKALKALRLDRWMGRAGISDEKQQHMWTNIVSQLVYWSVIIMFLIPAVESWGVPQITRVINEFLLYLPNVFAAVIIAFVGMIIANILYQVIRSAAQSIGAKAADIMANIARYGIIIFTVFIVLTELGVAENLIQILFTGFVATVAIATGLSVGLGAKDAVSKLLDQGIQSEMVQSKLSGKNKK